MIRIHIAGGSASEVADVLFSSLERVVREFEDLLDEVPDVTLAIPWWHANDVPRELQPPANVEMPRAPFRPVHRPGRTGKRTRRSQRLHNRRAA